MRTAVFRRLLLLGILACMSSNLAAQGLTALSTLSGYDMWNSLDYGNGDKVTQGLCNTLHVVWRNGDLIKYSTSATGLPGSWSTPELVAPGIPAAQPAIASDSSGTLVVAFVAYPGASGVGRIYYARKAWGASSWTYAEVVSSGTQPDIEAREGRVHLTWTTFNRVQYTSFSTSSPPAPLALGEEIEVSDCPGTGFVRPSVTLVRESCKLVPKVAYLRYGDERSNPNPSCTSLTTEVGPRVCARNPVSGTWGLEYSDMVNTTLPAVGVQAVSLSMNAQYKSGHTFLAWSDTSNGTARTRLAHGIAGAWDAINFSAVPMHAHVAVKPTSFLGDYRMAWSHRDGYYPFAGGTGSFRTGKWTTGPAPVWSEPSPVAIGATTGGAAIGSPQATYWGGCRSASYTTVEAVAIVEGACAAPRLVSHFEDGQACPGPLSGSETLPWDECSGPLTAHVFSDSGRTLVDFGDVGFPLSSGPGFVQVGFNSGGTVGNATLTWDIGQLVELEAGHLVIDNPQAQVQIASATHQVELVRLADNYIYDDLGGTPGPEEESCLGEEPLP